MTSRLRFISAHRAVYGVKRLCRVLAVSRSGFYQWVAGEQARQQRRDAEATLTEQIAAAHTDSGGAYGAPPVTVELRARVCASTTSGWSASCASAASSDVTTAGASAPRSLTRPQPRHRI